MTGPDQRAEFSPAELDLLEDALASLDGPAGGPEATLGLPGPLRERLDEYQSILGLTREAMPLVEVPDGILDAVIAEAQRAPATKAEGTRPAGLWERLRRSFVLPGFALAATAALLVIVLRPEDAAKSLEEAPAAAPSEPAAKDMSEKPAVPAAAAAPGAGDGRTDAVDEEDVAEAEAGAAAPEEEKMADRAAPPPPGSLADDKSSGRTKKEKVAPAKKPTSASKSAAGGLGDDLLDDPPTPKHAPAPIDAGDKDALRSLLSAADKARSSGRCGDAIGKYQQLRGVGGMEEARALVGLGLCAEAAGDAGKAEGYFAQARTLAPAIDSLIANERQKMGVGPKKASKVDFD